MQPTAVLKGFAALSAVLCLRTLTWLNGPESGNCPAWHAQWTNSTDNVCVVVRTWHAQFAFLPAFLAAFAGSVPAKVLFLPTDPRSDVGVLERIVKRAAGESFGCHDAADVIRVAPGIVEGIRRSLGIPHSEPDFAYGYTDSALDYLFGEDNSKNLKGCNWLLVTNGDDLYSTAFLDQLQPLFQANELIAWDFVSHYYDRDKVESDPRVKGSGKFFARRTEMKRKEIDLGAMLVNVPFFLRQKREGKPLRFLSNAVERTLREENATRTNRVKFHLSDGMMAEELVERTDKWSLMRRVLLIHQ